MTSKIHPVITDDQLRATVAEQILSAGRDFSYVCYKSAVPLGGFGPAPQTIYFRETSISFFFGSLVYLESIKGRPLDFSSDGLLTVPSLHSEFKNTETGLYVVLAKILPSVERVDVGKDGFGSLIALMAIVFGRRFVWEEIFFNTVSGDRAKVCAFSPSGEIFQEYFASPIRRHETTQKFCDVWHKLELKASTSRDGIELSLRWVAKGLAQSGVDAFISIWVAIEALSFQGQTSIDPLKRAFARIYAMPLGQVGRTFGLGRLHGLRSDIVHKGLVPAKIISLNAYLLDIYVDLLLHEVGVKSEGRARLALAGGDFLQTFGSLK